tara:strand:- start:588 stop:2702 length:2115 start_codon:yes stop_codon:yes gene_type:complete
MAKNLILKVSEKGAKKTATALKSVGSAVKDVGVKAGIATAGIGVLSAKLAGDFQKSLLEVSTLTGDFSDVALKKMSRELRQVASDSGLALDSISKAKYDIVSAGFSGAAESAEVLRVSAQLAVGGVTSAAEAADLLTTSLNAMGLSSADTQRVADDLFTTVQLGKTTIGELSATLGQVLPFANAAGLSLSGVGAAMATLTASGISTAQSATALRSAIQSLQSPTDQSKTLMRDMGIEIKRFDDGSIDLINTVKQFQGLDADTMRKLIPRVEGILAIQTMAQNFDKLSGNVERFANRTGSASEKAFEQMSKGFNTQFAKLKNNVQSIMITIGDVIIEQVQPFVEDANEELSELGNIGFDHMAKVIGENFSVVLEALNVTISLFIDSLQNRVTLAGMFIKKELASLLPDFISGSEDLQKEYDAMAENITKRNADNFDMVANQLAFTFDFIKEKAKESSQAEIAEMEQANLAKAELRTANNKNLSENLEIKGEIESADVEREKELLTVRGLAQKQYFDKVAEQVTQLKNLGVDATKAEQHGTKLRMQFMSQELSAKTSQAAGFLSLAKQATGNNKRLAGVTRALAKGEATVKAFEAANKTFAQFGGWPAGIVPAALALSIGMANVAAIDSQKFAAGGIVQGVDSGQGDTVPAMLTPGELVLNQAQQQNVANALGGITINFTGPITNDDYVRDFIIPEIDKVVRSNLA